MPHAILVMRHEIGHGVNYMLPNVSDQFTGKYWTKGHEIQRIRNASVGQTLPDVPQKIGDLLTPNFKEVILLN